jgi:MFS family permease
VGPFFGLLSDVLRTRKKLLVLFYAVAAASSYPIMYLLTLGSLTYLVLGAALLGIVFSSQYSILPAWLAEMMDTRVRFSGIGFIINTGVAFSSFAPYISTYLLSIMGTGIYGRVTAISIVTIIGALVSLIFVLFSRDRAGEPLD